MLDLRLDDQPLARFRDRLDEKALARAARRAGNEGIIDARRAGVDYVLSKKQITDRDTVDRRIREVLPSNRAGLGALRWALAVSARPIAIGAYKSRQTPQGVVAEVNVGESFLLRHAFLRTVRNGFRGVFERAGGQGSARYPIKSLVASGVGDVLRDSEAVAVIQQAFSSATAAAFARYAQIELDRNSAGG